MAQALNPILQELLSNIESLTVGTKVSEVKSETTKPKIADDNAALTPLCKTLDRAFMHGNTIRADIRGRYHFFDVLLTITKQQRKGTVVSCLQCDPILMLLRFKDI